MIETGPTPDEPNDDELHALITLMSLKNAGPRRLRAMLAAAPATEVVSALLQRQRPDAAESADPVSIGPGVWEVWFDDVRATSARVDLDDYRAHGCQILHPAHARWPFAEEPDPPILAFVRGHLELLAKPNRSVAIVGTRRCTSVGRQVAESLGIDLADADLAVVSGLALGIDAAAHRGALSAGGSVVGVVASGLDVVYPASNRDLWDAVSAHGVLLSEVPLGQRPNKWRFPARNRLIAALSELVVVVESHAKGGALSTADEAIERGTPVVVVPGSTLSPASDGTNALLVEGAVPVRHGRDVLDVLGIDESRRRCRGGDVAPTQLAIPLDAGHRPEQQVLDALAAGPVHLDRLIETLGVSLSATAALIDQLVSAGDVVISGHVVALAQQQQQASRRRDRQR